MLRMPKFLIIYVLCRPKCCLEYVSKCTKITRHAVRTGQVGEGNLALESEIFLVENVDSLAGDDQRPTTWTVATTVILGHHTRVLDTSTHTHTHIMTETQTPELNCVLLLRCLSIIQSD